jgi:hypothetical protein
MNCTLKENTIMKSILIAATTVGAAIAGLILYTRNKKSASSAGQLTYPGTGSSKLGNVKGERDMLHAMG